MIAVCRNDPVTGPNAFYHSCEYSFLPNVEVAKSAELLLNVEVSAAFFEAPHQQHIAVPFHIGSLSKSWLCGLLGGGFTAGRCFLSRRSGRHDAQIARDKYSLATSVNRHLNGLTTPPHVH